MGQSDNRHVIKDKLREAQALGLQRRYADADELLAQVLEADPDSVAARELRGEIALKGSNFQLAESCFRKLWRDGVRHPKVLANLGHALFLQSRFGEAQALYEESLTTGRSNLRTIARYADCLSRLGRYEQALQCLESVLNRLGDQSDLSTLEICRMAGVASARQGKLQKAEGYFRRALRIDSGSAALAKGLGEVLEGLGRHDEARDIYLACIARDQGNIELLDRAGIGELLRKDGTPHLLARSAELRGLPSFGGVMARSFAAPLQFRKIALVVPSPAVSDRYGAMGFGARALAHGLAEAGYVTRTVPAVVHAPLDTDVVVMIGINKGNIRVDERLKFIQICPPPPFTWSMFSLLSDIRQRLPRWTIAQIDKDTLGMAASLSGRAVLAFPAIYLPDLLDASRASKPLSQRPIHILYAGSNRSPEQYRSMWRAKPDLAKWGDALIESAPRDFTISLPEHASKVIADLGGELDLASREGCDLLDTVGKYLWASHKEKVLRILARFPCHMFLSHSKLPYKLHPKAKLFEHVPFPIYQDMMHESRAVVATLPSYITGGISERVCDPLVRGAVTIAARNNGLIRSGLRLGEEVLDFGADCAELEGYLERVMAGDPALQEVADAGREAGPRLFDPGARMGEFMALVEETWKEQG